MSVEYITESMKNPDEIILIEIHVSDDDYTKTLKLKEGTKNFFGKELISCKILVLPMTKKKEIIGAFIIRNPLNVKATYLEEEYRGRGLGTKCNKILINKARKEGLNFITSTVSSDNLISIHINLKNGFKKITYLKKSKQILLMLPLNFTGKTICTVLKNLCLITPNIFITFIHEFLYKISINND